MVLTVESVGGDSSSSSRSVSIKVPEVKEEKIEKIDEPFVTNHFEVTVSGIKVEKWTIIVW